jgi:hypothetical protein
MDAFYYNKLAGPPDAAEYDQYAPSPGLRAQSPQEQEILDRIAQAQRWQALHGGASALALGGAGASLAAGYPGMPLAAILTGLGGWQGNEAGKERLNQRTAESELEAYATRDRR